MRISCWKMAINRVMFCCYQDKCHQYWPDERSARYQYFVVDPLQTYNMPLYVLREFKVTDARVSLVDCQCVFISLLVSN